MKFYDCETAPSPRRVRIFIAEKGIDIGTVQVDLRRGEQFSAGFRRINPDCVVPVLELDDGSYISEVLAICQYLEELHPEPPMIGRDPLERARVRELERIAEMSVLRPVFVFLMTGRLRSSKRTSASCFGELMLKGRPAMS